jgi:hypothetical protein
MQIGFNAPTSGPLIDPDSLTSIIVEGEALGFPALLSRAKHSASTTLR